jgi:hypothetical protein
VANSGINKPKLLYAISAALAIIIMPLVMPHIGHPSMIYHILIHIAGIVLSTFLSIVSAISYKRTRSTRVLLMTVGFASLLVIETIYFLNATDMLSAIYIPVIGTELSHVLLFGMLALFGIGVLKVDK